jgi:rifampin ADP-ribosylating transferase
MALEDQGDGNEAVKLFLQAWGEASDDQERFLAAHYISRQQDSLSDQLSWLHRALELALRINDVTVVSAFPALYSNIAACYSSLGNADKAKEFAELAVQAQDNPTDAGPFYHGTKADLPIGELLTAGGNSNYKCDLIMNHIYFTALVNGAGLAAELAKGNGTPRVYIVEPTGTFENDPNVTDKKFPGNPTRSYRSLAPLRIIGEEQDWTRLDPRELRNWKSKLADNSGEIIN